MSTYTDLHMPIKESVVVDSRDRVTPQAVRLLNAENEYWGTFSGQANVTGGTVTDSTFVGVSSYNQTLVQPTILLSSGVKYDMESIISGLHDINTKILPVFELSVSTIYDSQQYISAMVSSVQIIAEGTLQNLRKNLKAVLSSDEVSSYGLSDAISALLVIRDTLSVLDGLPEFPVDEEAERRRQTEHCPHCHL